MLGHMVVIFWVFWEAFILCSTVTVPTYIPTNSVQGFHFLKNFHYLCFFDDSHSDRCEVISHHGFDLHFPDNLWCWTSFHVLIGYLHVLFGKMSIWVFCTFLNQIFLYWVVLAVYIFWILIPYWSYHLQLLFLWYAEFD